MHPPPASSTATPAAPESQTRTPETRRRTLYRLAIRLTFVLTLVSCAFFVTIFTGARDADGGSLRAINICVPLLAGLIASGYTQPPRGVSDAETDWILAILVAVTGFVSVELVKVRLPTISGLWNVDNIAMIVWALTSATVVFTVRHTLRMWPVWVYSLLSAALLPYVLITAGLGGTDTAAVLAAALLGTIAVLLAARIVSWWHRLCATAVHLATVLAATFLLEFDSLLLRVVIVAAIMPVTSVFAVHRITDLRSTYRIPHVTVSFPHRKPLSYLALVLVAVALLIHSLPVPPVPPVLQARADWHVRMSLAQVAEFGFIAKFTGAGSTLVRYGSNSSAAVAVDVLTVPTLARLRDFDDAVWYPSDLPVNYEPEQLAGPVEVAARALHSNADSSTSDTAQHWYAITWVWRTAEQFQRVTVIANQATSERHLPPDPRPLSVQNSIIGPLLWIARQQPDSVSTVDPVARQAAGAVARQVLDAGMPT
jgi:hypothetical protein